MPQKVDLNTHIVLALLCVAGMALFVIFILSSPVGEQDLDGNKSASFGDRPVKSGVARSTVFVIDDPAPPVPLPAAPSDRGDASSLCVRARVLDAHTGHCVTAFRAWISRDSRTLADGGWTSQSGEFVRDRYGMVTFGNLEKGTWTLLVRCPGYKDLLVPDLIVPQDEEILTLRLSRGTHICGTVIDSHGTPVWNARVIVKSLSGDRANEDSDLIFKKTTDKKGFYLVGDLEPGSYDVFLTSSETPTDCRRGLFVAEDSGLTINLTLPVRNRVEFRICSASGEPLKNTSVRLYAEERRFNTTTDADGRAVMERIPDGVYTLSIVKGGFYPLKEEFLLQTFEGIHEVNRKLQPAPRAGR